MPPYVIFPQDLLLCVTTASLGNCLVASEQLVLTLHHVTSDKQLVKLVRHASLFCLHASQTSAGLNCSRNYTQVLMSCFAGS